MFARIGQFCVCRGRLVLVAAVLLFAAGLLVGSSVFMHLKDPHGSSATESVQGQALLDRVAHDGRGMVALVDGPEVDDAGVREAVMNAATRVKAVDGVTQVVTAYDSDGSMLRAPDGHASLIVISTSKTDDMMRIHQVVADVRHILDRSVPNATVKVGGELAVMRDSAVTSESDLVRGELIALPLLIIALLWVFRSWRAGFVPIVGSLVTVAGALLLLRGAVAVIDVSGYAVDVIALFGLALSVDYSLLMVNRFREERGSGLPVDEATVRTVAAAGRTVTFSALTVTASLAGLFAFGDPTFNSLAIGGIATTLIALLAALTMTPALLARWGSKLQPTTPSSANAGVFRSLARRVQRHPMLVAGACALGLIALAVPFLSVNYGSGDPRLLPRSFESRAVADSLQTRFPDHQADPVMVIAQRSADDPAVQSYARQVGGWPGVAAATVRDAGGGVSVIDVVPKGTTQGPAAQSLVHTLRTHRPAYRSYVSGSAAFLFDFQHRIATRLPWALLLIGGATLVLLFLMTGSLLIPLKALVMNTLSLGATFGALVWVFQQGHLSGLLGFESFGAIEAWVPVVVFVFAFGLSMDYEVFLLSRIKEAHDRGDDSQEAVARGLQQSGRIITSAAVLVTIVFLGFALGQNLGIKEMGVALALAVVVDATVVRCLLVPATMTLLGERNWWAPRPLRLVHDRFGLRETADTIPPQKGPVPALN